MPTCLVNLVYLNPPRNGGASRFAQEVCRLLADCERANQTQIIFAVGAEFAADFPAWIDYPQAAVIPCLPEAPPGPVFKAIRPDFLVSPLFGMPPFDAPDDYGHIPHVTTIPDTLSLDKAELLPQTEAQFIQNLIRRSCHATKIITISDYSRRQLIKHLNLAPEQITVIHGAGKKFSVESDLLLPVSPPYVFYPANGWRHKRHTLLLQIMSHVWRLRPELKLVLTGYHEPGYIDRLIEQNNCPSDKVIDLGFVPGSHLAALYRQAEALLFVSEHEGFGLPLLEAMTNGCPVVCAPLASIPEVAGDAALYVNSDDPQVWSDALLNILPQQRTRLIEQGKAQANRFSWERVRQQWLEVLVEAGLQLAPSQKQSDSSDQNLLDVPLAAVRQELAGWSNEYVRLRTEVEAKEAQIQNMAVTTRQHVDELIAKEAVIRRSALFRATSPLYWLSRPVRWLKPWANRQLTQRLGILAQYSPRPPHVPAWYTAQPTPNPAPLISIVTPSFNQAHFLERTLRSVLDQNYPTLEYIVQDGGSADATQVLLNRYRNRLTHVESTPDNGQAHALNLGFAHTTGQIMAYLNSDDLLLPGALNYVAAYFIQNPQVDVVYGHRVVIDQNDDEIGRWVLPPHDDRVLHWADYIPQETLFWRRSIWEKAGGVIDESHKFALDWELLLRFQKAGAKMVCLPRFLGAFRVHATQKTSAQLDDLGAEEMARLRQQCHGRPVSWAEIGRGIGPYLVKSVLYYWLYRWGLRRY